MKNYRTILLAALVAFPLVAACNKENAESGIMPDDEAGLVSLTLSATGETEGEATPKVTFDETNNACWENSDHIAVFDGSGKRDFSLKSGTNTGATALFEGTVASGYSNLYTVYPYAAASSLSGSNVTVTVPSVQTVSSSNRVDPSAIVSVGKVNTSTMSVEFKQVCGLVSFVIATDNIYKVIIEGTNIAGTATVASETGVLSSVSSASGKVTVSYSGDGNFAQGKYYVAVLPGTTGEGDFSVAFVHEDGLTERQAVSAEVTIARKGRKAAGTVTNDNPKVRHIYNKAQLDAWGAAMGDGGGDEQYFTVYLEKDIDYGSSIWPYTANDTHFNGNFQGQNHKIYNIKIESATNTSFLTGLYGSLNDLIFGSSDGVNWDGKSYIKHTGNSGAVEYVGLIGELRANNDTFMDNVINFAPVSVPSGSYNTRAFIGGLVGHIPSGKTVTMTNCKNYGSVSNASTWTGDPTRIGGILGQCEGALLGSGLENHGGLTVNNAKTTFIGGLCGDLGAGSEVFGSSNYGSITFSDSGTSKTYFGGCFGTIRGTTIYNCHNYGAQTISRNAEHWFGGIVGFLEAGNITISNCTNHTGANLEVASSVSSMRAIMGGITGGCQYNGDGPFSVTLQGCHNEASVTNYGSTSDFGGMAGLLDNYLASAIILLQNCENTGAIASEVADNGTSMNRELRMGGIVGGTDPESAGCDQTIRSCINRGTVTVKGALKSGASVRFGGIVGNTYANTKIDQCKNSGNVECPNAGGDAGSAVFYLGGIVGAFQSRTSTRYQSVTDCVNTGAVSSIRNFSNQYLGGIVGGGTNPDTYPVVSGSKNFGNVSATRTVNTLVGGLCGYTRWNMSNCSNFGSVSGGSHNGAVVGDANGNAIMTTGIKVGVDVNVTGAANVGTKYTEGKKTYTFTTASSSGKRWFSGDGTGAAITVTVVDQESAPSF